MHPDWFTSTSTSGREAVPRAGRWAPARRAVSALAAAVAFLGAIPAAAQQGASEATIAGIVTDEADMPLSAAQVRVRGGGQGALTDEAGRFRIVGVPGAVGASVTLEARRIGYRLTTLTARVGDQDVRVRMPVSALSLGSVVVTGQAGEATKRELGVSVAQVDASEIVDRGTVRDVQTLINGRAPGVTILQNSGTIGSGATVRIRGASSFSLTNQPLIYIDGVRVDNAQGTGPLNQGFGASTTSRWNDINPNDIESVEIVRGPAATTLYGTEAANGVIQIITKRGSVGAPTWDLSVRQGITQFADPEGRLWTNYAEIEDAAGNVIDTASLDQVDRYADMGTDIWTNGHLQTYSLGLGGGSSAYRYYVSGNLQNDRGVERVNKQRLQSLRANFGLFPSAQLDVSTNVGYVWGRTELPFEAGGGGTTWTTYYATPANLGTVRDGFYSGLPEAYHQQYQSWQDIQRLTASVQVSHRPISWFSHRLTAGTDQGTEDGHEVAPIHLDLEPFFGTDATEGYHEIFFRDVALHTANYSATAAADLLPGLRSSTSIGGDLYLRTTQRIYQYGRRFPAPGVTAINATTLGREAEQTVEEHNTVGAFLQEELAWQDRIFLTLGVRMDDNSAFGKNFDRVYYPKASLSWIASDESYVRIPFLTTLKLRAAYGESGQAPLPYAAVPVYQAAIGFGNTAAVTPLSLGNVDLGPERGFETELGFDAAFLGDRAGIEFTYFFGGTRDAILEKQAPPSSGFPGTQLVNGGKLERHGMEMLLRGTPIQRERTALDLSLSLSTNETEVVDLKGSEFIVPSTNIRHQVGYPVGSWFGKRVVGATRNDDDTADEVFCDDGQGGQVACSAAPPVYLGRTTPNLEGALTANLRVLENLQFSAMLDWKRGYKKLDGNRRVRCFLFYLCRENYYPGEFSDVVAGEVSSSGHVSGYVSDASYTKLREISATYTLPAEWAQMVRAGAVSISIAGRNLHTWTNYSGLEPEASFQGGSRGFGQWEQNVTPQLRSFVTSIQMTF
ncbi:MAG TPA: SusC/RagA family TonB-linked outer membrane protein [Gemmatimonadaceae bacterium]